jgi:hypothetical protein
LAARAYITLLVALKLCFPKGAPTFGWSIKGTSMPMPKTAVDKYAFFQPTEHKIGAARKISAMQAIAKPH